MATQKKHPKYTINGWICLDKPYEMTSTQAVGAIKRLLKPKKIGHAGTLDPLATGVLPLALGEATKTVPHAMNATKDYLFTLKFGIQTSTDDIEGEAIAVSNNRPTKKDIIAVLPIFTGEIEQTPPAFSAIKVDGKRAYDLARAGKEIKLKSRQVVVHKLKLIEYDGEEAKFSVTCGKGTYIRSIARDLSATVGTVGHVSSLRRTRVGGFSTKNYISLETLEKLVYGPTTHGEMLHYLFENNVILPTDMALDDILAIRVSKESAVKLRHGQAIDLQANCIDGLQDIKDRKPDIFRVYDSNILVALAEMRENLLFPLRVFNVE